MASLGKSKTSKDLPIKSLKNLGEKNKKGKKGHKKKSSKSSIKGFGKDKPKIGVSPQYTK